MASSTQYEMAVNEVRKLPHPEQLRLIEFFAHELRESIGQDPKAPRWEDFIGAGIYPQCGEDAQEWVSREREESDRGREVQ